MNAIIELKERNNQIIDTMITQLGGRRFFMMTGSKPLYKKIDTGNPTIALKLARNTSKATHLKITYMEGLDTYTMEFTRIWGMNEPQVIKEVENVYCDQLESVFTSITGLETRL